MSRQQFFKGILLLIVSMLLTALSQTPVDVALLFVTAISALFGYIGKNILFVTATTTLTKVVSGLLVVFGTALTESIGMIAVGGIIIWPVLFKVLAGVFLTYIVTTFLMPPATQSKQIRKVSLS